MATVPLTGTPGFRFLWQLYPSARSGGLSYYSYYSTVEQGLAPSWTPPTASGLTTVPTTYTVAISAGRAYLDGEISILAAGQNVAINPGDPLFAPPVNGVNDYPIYLSPTRTLQPVVKGSAAPTTYLNGDAVTAGAQYAECIDFGEYLGATDFYQYSGGTWSKYDPTFAAPMLPAQAGKNRIYGGGMVPKVGANNLTVRAQEKRIYIENKYPPYTNSNSKALLRDSCSLELGNVSLYYFVLPLSVKVATTAGSATITTDAATAAVLADMVAAAGSIGTLAVKLTGPSGFFTGGGASSNITAVSGTNITTAATVVANNAEVTLTIEPQTAGRTYLLAPAKSALLVNNIPV